MSDTAINQFVASGTAAEMAAFTPTPPTPAAGPDNGYFFFQTDTGLTYSWDGAVWVQTGGGGATSVTSAGTLTANAIVLGAGAKAVSALGSLGTTTTVLHGNAAGAPTFGQVNLTAGADVTGDLPLANLVQGTALSVLGVTGNATADNASIVAASDHQVLRRSGTSVAFGQVNLGQSAAVTGILPVANGGTGSATGAAILKVTLPLTNADIINLPTTAITVIAAPGANLRIHPLSGYMMVDTTAADYGTIHANCLFDVTIGGSEYFSYLLNGNGTGLTQVTDLLTPSTEAIWRWQPYVLGGGNPGTSFTDDWGLTAGIIDSQAAENQPLVVSCNNSGAGIFTGGNAGNTGRIVVLYMLEPTL